jgi:hypothetical protein
VYDCLVLKKSKKRQPFDSGLAVSMVLLRQHYSADFAVLFLSFSAQPTGLPHFARR